MPSTGCPPRVVMEAPERVFVGIGGNLGDARATVLEAAQTLKALPGSARFELSALYRSTPVEASGPDFINAVAAFDTPLRPLDLLHRLQAIELEHGRLRPYRNAPRTLDLDLLLHGARTVSLPGLTVPHPRMHLRAFVLRPLLDLDPAAVIPGLGPARDRLPSVADQSLERLET